MSSRLKRRRDWSRSEREARKGLKAFNNLDIRRARERGKLFDSLINIKAREVAISAAELASAPVVKLPPRSAKGLRTISQEKGAAIKAARRAKGLNLQRLMGREVHRRR